MRELASLASLVNNKNTAHDGQAIHAMVYLTALKHDAGLRANPFGPKAMDWKTLDTALSSFSNRFGSSDLYNHHVALAYLAGDKARATPLFLQTLKRYPAASSVWARYWGGEAAYNRCKTWALGEQRPA